jgi:hypothetical protein
MQLIFLKEGTGKMKNYILIHPTSAVGMCGSIWQVIRAMYHYPNEKFYVLLGNDCLFYDPNVEDTQNVWEYYFEQPHAKNLPSKEEIIKEVGLLQDEFSEFRDNYMKSPTKDFIYKRRAEYNNIINQNLKLKPNLLNKINFYYDAYFKNKKVLGIHCRSTDHPDKIDIEYCMNMLDSLSNQYDFIFASSDDEAQIKKLKDFFGKKLITHDSVRSFDGQPVHHRYDQRISGRSNYKVGEDVIIESYLLSKTNFLFCTTNSNVNYFIRALNPNLPYIIINHHYTA